MGESDELRQFSGKRLDAHEAIRVISAFRAKYHRGHAEALLNEKGIAILRKRYEGAPDNLLPDDVIQFRIERYGNPELNIPTSIPPLTWGCFPPESIRVTHHILRRRDFQNNYPKLYLSIWTTGQDVFETTPAEVQAFFSDEDHQHNRDYYIFEPELRWCIAITHDDYYILVGDFRIF